MNSRIASAFTSTLFLAAALYAQTKTATKFGLSPKDFGTATLAAATSFSESAAQNPNSLFYGALTCKGANCLFWSMPLSGMITTSTVIFTVGPWRIAATCENGEMFQMYPCTTPKDGSPAWIELNKNGAILKILYSTEKKPLTATDAEKRFRSKWQHFELRRIVLVHNVSTNESWPKSLQETIAK